MNTHRVHRLLRLITTLQSGRSRTTGELLAILGVSRRTLFRDLSMLNLAGIPYYHEAGEGYRIGAGFFLPPVSLTVPETLGLMLLGKAAAAQRGQPFTAAAVAAIDKLVSTVPEPIRGACQELLAHVTVAPGKHPAADATAEQERHTLLQRAIDERRACVIGYTSPVAAAVKTELEPYALHFVGHAWYVFGRSVTHGEVRVFKLARIQSIEPGGRRFDRPAGWTVASKVGAAWQMIPEGKLYDVELRFTPLLAMNVSEVRWHPSQRHELLPDGSCRMTFRVDGLGEIAWWLCGYADQVTIVKPRALREKVAKMLRAAVQNHSSPEAPLN